MLSDQLSSVSTIWSSLIIIQISKSLITYSLLSSSLCWRGKVQSVFNFSIYLFVIYFSFYLPVCIFLFLWSLDTFRNTLMNDSYIFFFLGYYPQRNIIFLFGFSFVCLTHNHNIILSLLFIRTNIYNLICHKSFGCQHTYTQTYMYICVLNRFI